MAKIRATTYVICPVGTTIELYETFHPKIGTEFDIRHIDTKKVVQRARVKNVEDLSSKVPQPKKWFRVLAEIIK